MRISPDSFQHLSADGLAALVDGCRPLADAAEHSPAMIRRVVEAAEAEQRRRRSELVTLPPLDLEPSAAITEALTLSGTLAGAAEFYQARGELPKARALAEAGAAIHRLVTTQYPPVHKTSQEGAAPNVN